MDDGAQVSIRVKNNFPNPESRDVFVESPKPRLEQPLEDL
jgi:hypothetical protein